MKLGEFASHSFCKVMCVDSHFLITVFYKSWGFLSGFQRFLFSALYDIITCSETLQTADQLAGSLVLAVYKAALLAQ